MPYAFTEQGIYMLMTVLKGELATRQSIALIDTFKRMKDYIVSVVADVGVMLLAVLNSMRIMFKKA